MTKRSNNKLLEVLDNPLMATLEPDTRMLWLDIARVLQKAGISVLRFGIEVLKPKSLLRLLNRPETETETDLETKITKLCERGFLRLESDGAISCPLLAAAQTRAEINRANGLRGGRPRKDGQPPGQRTMLLPLQGGVKVETEKTETQTKPAETDAHTSSKTINNSNDSKVSDAEYHDTGRAVLDAIGIDPARSFLHYGHVMSWLQAGASKELIVEVITRIMARPGASAERVKSLKFFDAAIRDELTKQPKAKPEWEREWERANRLYELTGRGERPRVEDYKRRFAA